MSLNMGEQLPRHTKSSFRNIRRKLKNERNRKIRRLTSKNPEVHTPVNRFNGWAD